MMYHYTDNLYIQSRAIKLGMHHLHPVHQQFVDTLSKLLNTSVLDFSCDAKRTTAGYKQQVLLLVVERKAECERVEKGNYTQQIIQAFMPFVSSLEGKLRGIDPLKSSVFNVSEQPFPEIVITYTALESIELMVTKKNANDAIVALRELYEQEVWSITSYNDCQNVILFYHTDQQIKANQANGLTDKIRQAMFKELKKHDVFDYFGPEALTFFVDSKESFDRDFKGNWHYYFQ